MKCARGRGGSRCKKRVKKKKEKKKMKCARGRGGSRCEKRVKKKKEKKKMPCAGDKGGQKCGTKGKLERGKDEKRGKDKSKKEKQCEGRIKSGNVGENDACEEKERVEEQGRDGGGEDDDTIEINIHFSNPCDFRPCVHGTCRQSYGSMSIDDKKDKGSSKPIRVEVNKSTEKYVVRENRRGGGAHRGRSFVCDCDSGWSGTTCSVVAIKDDNGRSRKNGADEISERSGWSSFPATPTAKVTTTLKPQTSIFSKLSSFRNSLAKGIKRMGEKIRKGPGKRIVCKSDYCQNGGKCTIKSHPNNELVCECDKGWTGHRCQVI